MAEYKDPKISGFMSYKDLNWLYNKALEMESILEIGSWKGKSTHALLSGCKGEVFAVDTFDGADLRDTVLKEAKEVDIHKLFQENLKGFDNLKTFIMTSEEAFKLLSGKRFDMVFIDGNHNFDPVCFDIQTWLPVTNKLICGHDWKHPPVKKAVMHCLGGANTSTDNIWYKEL